MHCGKSNQTLRGSVSEVKKHVLLVPEIAVRLRNRSCKCNRVHYNKSRVLGFASMYEVLACS